MSAGPTSPARWGPGPRRCWDWSPPWRSAAIIFSVGLVVGGSIVIPHLRRAMARLEELEGRP